MESLSTFSDDWERISIRTDVFDLLNDVGVAGDATRRASMTSFYRRPLPSPPCTGFSTPKGKLWFVEALQEGTADGFFPLAEQFSTQAEPAFCGLTTLSVALNALEVDPKRSWKGVWRWYHEDMLDCCEDIEKVRQDGITFEKLACLARCNGLRVKSRVSPAKETNSSETTEYGTNLGKILEEDMCSCSRAPAQKSEEGNFEEFRRDVQASAAGDGSILIVSYSRSVLGQTGDGHFSPIGAYHRGEDQVLVMDVARYKYPPHWVPLKLLWEATRCKDKVTGRPRGYMKFTKDASMHASLLTIDLRQENSSKWIDFLLNGRIPEILKENEEEDSNTQLHAILAMMPSPPSAVISCYPKAKGTTSWACCQHGEQREAAEGIYQSLMRKAVSQILAEKDIPWHTDCINSVNGSHYCSMMMETYNGVERLAILLAALLLAIPSVNWEGADNRLLEIINEKLSPAAKEEVDHLRSQLQVLDG